MVKRALYDIANDSFALFLNKVNRLFREKEIPYMFVGGTAVQLHITKIISQAEGKTIEELATSRRLQDYLRPTDDVDIAICPSVCEKHGIDSLAYFKYMAGVLKEIEGEHISPNEERIIGFEVARMGSKRPVFNVVIDGKRSDEQKIAMNIGCHDEDLRNVEKRYYRDFLNAREKVDVPYNKNLIVKGSVIPLTYLLATKIANFRPKDLMDLHNLYSLIEAQKEKIDLPKIEEIVNSERPGNFEKFLGLIGKF